MALDGTVSVSWVINDRRTVGISTKGNLPVQIAPSIAYTDGVGANQANREYAATRALTSGADSVDLNGALLDLYGSSVALVRVKAIIIQNLSSANTMTFGADGTDPWIGLLNSTGTITLNPGAFFVVGDPTATGMVVTATTHDLLKVVGTGTDTYTIAFIGGLT